MKGTGKVYSTDRKTIDKLCLSLNSVKELMAQEFRKIDSDLLNIHNELVPSENRRIGDLENRVSKIAERQAALNAQVEALADAVQLLMQKRDDPADLGDGDQEKGSTVNPSVMKGPLQRFLHPQLQIQQEKTVIDGLTLKRSSARPAFVIQHFKWIRKCYICRQPGHEARRCPTRGNERQQSRRQGPSRLNGGHPKSNSGFPGNGEGKSLHTDLYQRLNRVRYKGLKEQTVSGTDEDLSSLEIENPRGAKILEAEINVGETGMEDYDGNPLVSLNEYFNRFRCFLMQQMFPPTAEQAVAHLVGRLKGRARFVYDALAPAQKTDFDAIEAALKAKFSNAECIRAAELELQNTYQGPRETVHDFTVRVANLLHTILEGKPEEELERNLRRETMNRLREDIREYVLDLNPESYEKVLLFARRRESALLRRQTSGKPAYESYHFEQGFRCFACRNIGHFARDCPTQRANRLARSQWRGPRTESHCHPENGRLGFQAYDGSSASWQANQYGATGNQQGYGNAPVINYGGGPNGAPSGNYMNGGNSFGAYNGRASGHGSESRWTQGPPDAYPTPVRPPSSSNYNFKIRFASANMLDDAAPVMEGDINMFDALVVQESDQHSLGSDDAVVALALVTKPAPSYQQGEHGDPAPELTADVKDSSDDLEQPVLADENCPPVKAISDPSTGEDNASAGRPPGPEQQLERDHSCSNGPFMVRGKATKRKTRNKNGLTADRAHVQQQPVQAPAMMPLMIGKVLIWILITLLVLMLQFSGVRGDVQESPCLDNSSRGISRSSSEFPGKSPLDNFTWIEECFALLPVELRYQKRWLQTLIAPDALVLANFSKLDDTKAFHEREKRGVSVQQPTLEFTSTDEHGLSSILQVLAKKVAEFLGFLRVGINDITQGWILAICLCMVFHLVYRYLLPMVFQEVFRGFNPFRVGQQEQQAQANAAFLPAEQRPANQGPAARHPVARNPLHGLRPVLTDEAVVAEVNVFERDILVAGLKTQKKVSQAPLTATGHRVVVGNKQDTFPTVANDESRQRVQEHVQRRPSFASKAIYETHMVDNVRRCFACQQPGHMVKECPNRRNRGRRPQVSGRTERSGCKCCCSLDSASNIARQEYRITDRASNPLEQMLLASLAGTYEARRRPYIVRRSTLCEQADVAIQCNLEPTLRGIKVASDTEDDPGTQEPQKQIAKASSVGHSDRNEKAQLRSSNDVTSDNEATDAAIKASLQDGREAPLPSGADSCKQNPGTELEFDILFIPVESIPGSLEAFKQRLQELGVPPKGPFDAIFEPKSLGWETLFSDSPEEVPDLLHDGVEAPQKASSVFGGLDLVTKMAGKGFIRAAQGHSSMMVYQVCNEPGIGQTVIRMDPYPPVDLNDPSSPNRCRVNSAIIPFGRLLIPALDSWWKVEGMTSERNSQIASSSTANPLEPRFVKSQPVWREFSGVAEATATPHPMKMLAAPPATQ